MTKKTLSEIQEMLAKGELQKVSDEPADEDLPDKFWEKSVVRNPSASETRGAEMSDDDDYENEKRLPPGSWLFFVMPAAIALWGVFIWAVLK